LITAHSKAGTAKVRVTQRSVAWVSYPAGAYQRWHHLHHGQGEPTQLPRARGLPFGAFLGPWPDRVELEVEHLERVDRGSYVREKVSYADVERLARFGQG
jgi:hypothetical protein